MTINRYAVYMNGFQCNFTGATSTKRLAKPKVARRYVVYFITLIITTTQ